MNQQEVYQHFKFYALGRGLDVDGQFGNQCVDVIDAYAQYLFPGVAWSISVPPVASAKMLGSHHNPQYFDWIENDHNNPSQLPVQGDVLVCDSTPQAGYANQFANPDGHTGIVDSCNSSGYVLLQQDGSRNVDAQGNAHGVSFLNSAPVAWRYRPVLGWLRAKLAQSAPQPAPAAVQPIPVGHTLTLPATTGPWHLYNEGGSYNPNDPHSFHGIIDPRAYGRPLSYAILADLGNGKYRIRSEMFGEGVLNTKGSDVVVS